MLFFHKPNPNPYPNPNPIPNSRKFHEARLSCALKQFRHFLIKHYYIWGIYTKRLKYQRNQNRYAIKKSDLIGIKNIVLPKKTGAKKD